MHIYTHIHIYICTYAYAVVECINTCMRPHFAAVMRKRLHRRQHTQIHAYKAAAPPVVAAHC